MFSDLERLDICYVNVAGELVVVQTDHRDAVELQQDDARSTVFAFARVMNARTYEPEASSEPRRPVVVHSVFQGTPPPALRTFLDALGSVVLVGTDQLPAQQPLDPELVAQRLDEAMATVGQEALRSVGGACDLTGLRAVEAELAPLGEDFAARMSEERYTAMLRVAAAAGEVLRANRGGAWRPGREFAGPFPLVFESGAATPNLFGRAQRLFTEGVSRGPSVVVDSVLAHPEQLQRTGPLLPLLKPSGFGAGQMGAASRPLLATGGDEIPVIFLVNDHPTSVSYAQLDDAAFGARLPEALENLTGLDVEVALLASHPIYVVEGSYFAASLVLHLGFLGQLAEHAGATRLFVGLPTTQVMFVAPAGGDAEATAHLMEMVRQAFDESGDPLSPLLFEATPEQGVVAVVPWPGSHLN